MGTEVDVTVKQLQAAVALFEELSCCEHEQFEVNQDKIEVPFIYLFSYYLLTHGAERFLRSCQLCSHSRNS
jgi:hypothetical protein